MNVTVTINGRPIDVNVQDKQEEEKIGAAVERINALIAEFRKYKIDDNERIYMMCLLEFASSSQSSNKATVSEEDKALVARIRARLEATLELGQ